MVEIADVLNMNAHNAIYGCNLCDISGKNLNHTTFFFRGSFGIPKESARITREYRQSLLHRLGTKEDTLCFQGNSRYVDELHSFFPMSVCFGDSLHVIYEGIMEMILKNLKDMYPRKYERLVEISKKIKCPRVPYNYLNYRVDGYMSANNIKHFLIGYGFKCLILAGFPPDIVNLVKKLRMIVSELEEKEDKNLTVGRILYLHQETLNWTDEFARLFGNSAVVSKVHKLEHIIAECILIGKFWTHSCFPFETINLVITRGVKGTSQPIPSIVRSWRKFQYCSLWYSVIRNNQDNKNLFWKTFPIIQWIFFVQERLQKTETLPQ